MDITVAYSELLCGHEWLEDGNLLLNLTALNPCAPTNLDKEARSPRIRGSQEESQQVLGHILCNLGSTSANYVDVWDPGLGYASPCQVRDSQTCWLHVAIHSGWEREAAEGRDTAHLRRHFWFVLY